MKRKIVCGIILCLTLAAAGCGKNSEEQQAANYYQNELGLDREDAEALASALYGEDEEDEYIPEEEPEVIVIEPLPELLNSEWYEEKVQVYDMIFSNDFSMTEADIRAAVETSAYDVELEEGFDGNGNVIITGLLVDGKRLAEFKHYNNNEYLVECGLLDDGEYYLIDCSSARTSGQNLISHNCYGKAPVEFESLETRDGVIAYLAENGFVEVERDQSPYFITNICIEPERAEFADALFYYCDGVQHITLYRARTISETDQDIPNAVLLYSGGHLNLVDNVEISFNTDGTIQQVFHGAAVMKVVLGENIGRNFGN